MANNVYIGSRYVPIFDGTWDNTKVYEPLTIVEYGNSSYTSKKQVPAGTLPTNTTYWALTGNYNGQIANLDSRLTTAEEEIDVLQTSRRKFILIGDSFGYGVVGGGAAQGTGWLQGFANHQPAGTTFFLNAAEVGELEGVAGFCSTLPFLTILQTIKTTKLGTTSPEEITDIVVLGGTNDYGAGASAADLKNAIRDFMTYANANFPKAKTKIGVIGRRIHDMMLNGINGGYAQCMDYNAEYIEDTFGLMILPQYYSADGTHITADGYTFYQKYINEAIVCGRCPYNFQFKVSATLDSQVIDNPPGFTAWIDHNNHATKIAFSYANDSYKEWPVQYVTPAANGVGYSNFITLATAVEFPRRYQSAGEWLNLCEVTADSKKVVNPAQHAYYYVTDKTHLGMNVGNSATPVSNIDRMVLQIDPSAATYVEYAPV